ncbi:MAG: flagellin FliC, partial [Deltaproteobacteria bacterium]|nr:flagellin FliC [Deltaproteobacteria bacterium]
DSEYQQLKSEIDRISIVTEYNGQKLIDGTISTAALNFQIGFQNTSNDRISITVNSAGASALQLSETNAISITAATEAQSALTQIDSAITIVASLRGDIGARQSRLNTAISNLGTTVINYEAAVSSITDADFAVETANFTKNQIIAQAAVSVLAQANVLPQQALALLG